MVLHMYMNAWCRTQESNQVPARISFAFDGTQCNHLISSTCDSFTWSKSHLCIVCLFPMLLFTCPWYPIKQKDGYWICVTNSNPLQWNPIMQIIMQSRTAMDGFIQLLMPLAPQWVSFILVVSARIQAQWCLWISLSFFFTVNATHDGHNFRLVESLQRNKRNRCQYSQRQETTQAYCRGNSRLVIAQRCSVTVSTTYWLLVFIRSLLLTTTFLQRQAIQE